MRLEFFPFPFLTGCLALVILLILLRERKRSLSYLFCFAVFGVYILAVVSMTLFPIPIRVSGDWRQPAADILSQVNLIPFYFGGLFNMPPIYAFQELVGNILLTIPLGFGLPFIAPLKARHYLGLAFAAGLTIELSQLIASLIVGGNYRSVDINDVLLNAAGTLIGYGLFRTFVWLYLAVTRHLKTQPRGLFAYIQNIARGV